MNGTIWNLARAGSSTAPQPYLMGVGEGSYGRMERGVGRQDRKGNPLTNPLLSERDRDLKMGG